MIGCVPLTAALETLARGPGHSEDLERPGALPVRLGRLSGQGRKPFVVVLDAGSLYDPLAAAIASEGLPVFRAADRAMRALAAWCRSVG